MLWVLLVLVSSMHVAAQTTSAQPQAPVAGQSTPQSPAQSSDPIAQMRDDLNRLESLNQNMSTEIEFLHDQNLQILLRTNSQMWMLLIRDLRRQIEREEQQKGKSTPPTPK